MRSISNIPPVVGLLLGVSLFELSNTVLYLIQPLFFPTLIRVIGVLVILYYAIHIAKKSLVGKISGIYQLLILWSLFIILRGSLVGNYLPGESHSLLSSFRYALLNSYGGFAYLIPLVAVINIRLNSLYYVKKIALIFCMASLVMMFAVREQLAYGMISEGMSTLDVNGERLSVRNIINAAYPGFGILLFCLFNFNYVGNKYSILLPVTIFIFFIGYAVGGGRGMTFFSLFYLLVFFYLTVKYPLSASDTHGIKVKKLFGKKIIYFLLLVAFIYLIFYLYQSTTIFDYVLERAFGSKGIGFNVESESREILVRDMSHDFNQSPIDWIIGRGVNGSYATSHLSIGGRRAWMELSYYYLILKGGVIFLALFVFCFLHGAYMGILKSNNLFSKALGFMCVAMLVNLASASAIPQYSTFYLISWLCFGLVERKEVRIMSDADIYGYFNIKNYRRISS